MSDAKISSRREAGGDPPDEFPSLPRRSSGSRASGALSLAALALFLGVAAYPRMFAILVPWDDEGYFLLTLRSFRRMGALYDRVFTYYGPLYYLLLDGTFAALRLSISHDHGRLVSLGLWLAASLVAGVAIFRLTGRLWIGCAAQIGVFWSLLVPMPFEPLHPAALLALLLACLVATALLVPRRPRAALAIQGVLVASVGLVKVNVGAFALLGVSLAAVSSFPALRERRWLAGSVAIAAALAAPLLMAGELGVPWVRSYALLVSASAVALCVPLLASGPVPRLGPPPLLAFLASAAVTVAVVVLAVLARGTSAGGLVQALFVAPFRQVEVFRVPTVLPPYAGELAWLLPAVAAAAVFRRRGWPGREAGGAGALLLSVGRVVAGILLAISAIEVGFVLVPLAWIAAVPPRHACDSQELAYGRRLLPSLAVLQTLHGYPVGGSHISWASFLLVPVAALCVADGLRELAVLLAARAPAFASRARRMAPALGLLAALGLATAFYRSQADDRALYRSGVPLPLPGSSRLRLPRAQVAALVWLRESILQHCSMVIGLPGLASLHFWTGLEPPNGFNVGTWMFLFGPEIQQDILDRVRPIERLCVVRNQSLIDMWSQGRPMPPGPLLDYVLENFTPIGRRRGYELLVRSEAAEREGSAPPSPGYHRAGEAPGEAADGR